MSNDANLIIKKFNNFYIDYTDSKESERYLIHFKTTNSDELRIYVTSGSNQWMLNINDKLSSTLQQNIQLKHQSPAKSHNYNEFLESLFNILSKKQFSLQKVFNTETSTDMQKFETNNLSTKQISFFLKLNDNYKAIENLNDICFNLYDKLKQLEDELKKVNAQQAILRAANSENVSESDWKSNSATSTAQQHQRKQGMSIINPQSRKRKVPKGVQFVEDDDESEEA